MPTASWRLERRLSVDARPGRFARVGGVAGRPAARRASSSPLTGRTPLSLLGKAIDGTFGDRQGMEQMALLLTPILMNALAVHIALRMKIWNIGSEGQFFMGAWAAAGIGIHWDGPVPRAAS